jgi:hypothetical protein
MNRILTTLSFAVLTPGSLAIVGCQSDQPSDPAQANAALSAPYMPGTGVSGNSFGRHPRFYTGGATDDQSAPPTQPAGR